jgi:hypothetical protein
LFCLAGTRRGAVVCRRPPPPECGALAHHHLATVAKGTSGAEAGRFGVLLFQVVQLQPRRQADRRHAHSGWCSSRLRGQGGGGFACCVHGACVSRRSDAGAAWGGRPSNERGTLCGDGGLCVDVDEGGVGCYCSATGTLPLACHTGTYVRTYVRMVLGYTRVP